MDPQFQRFAPFVFPVFFLAMWLGVTTVLGVMSGWFALMSAFPDNDEKTSFKLTQLSGSMGLSVHMNGILTLSVCPCGLRVSIWRLFGPFSQNFMVPWNQITVERRTRFFVPRADLMFGQLSLGHLEIPAHVADRLARRSVGRWPEKGPFKQETNGEAARAIALQWLAVSTFSGLFFTLAPRLTSQGRFQPPMEIAIFPALIFGVASLFAYFGRVKR
ncbi:MAG TPA: hypothetical protein VGI79_18095 [Caulobacteraceae bacterium]|jgi:hypothetical protein